MTSEANGADEAVETPPSASAASPLAELRERAAALTWDPEHLRAFLVDRVDALAAE
jgi:hypothetical protein